jgi:hypothetical protein
MIRVQVWPRATAPLAGAGGLGRQLARLASITNAGQCGMSTAALALPR